MKNPLLITALALVMISGGCDNIDITGFGVSVDTRFEESAHWNNNHNERTILAGSDNYTIYSMSDSHVTSASDNLNLFFRNAIDENAVATVMVGDLTNTGKEKDYDFFEQHLPGDGEIGLFPIAGNHDLYSGGWKEFYSRFGSSTYFFTVVTPTASDIYICVDSGSGTLGKQQLIWLQDILEKERNKHRYCVLFSHYQFLEFSPMPATGFMPEEMDYLMNLFAEYNINLAISGHLHRTEEGVFGNTSFVVMPPLKDNSSNSGYLVLTVSTGEINYSFENLD